MHFCASTFMATYLHRKCGLNKSCIIYLVSIIIKENDAGTTASTGAIWDKFSKKKSAPNHQKAAFLMPNYKLFVQIECRLQKLQKKIKV